MHYTCCGIRAGRRVRFTLDLRVNRDLRGREGVLMDPPRIPSAETHGRIAMDSLPDSFARYMREGEAFTSYFDDLEFVDEEDTDADAVANTTSSDHTPRL